MTCEHCQTIRDAQRRLVDDCADSLRYPGLYSSLTSDTMTQRLSTESWESHWSAEQRQSLGKCACTCHDAARMVGVLPRLAATP